MAQQADYDFSSAGTPTAAPDTVNVWRGLHLEAVPKQEAIEQGEKYYPEEPPQPEQGVGGHIRGVVSPVWDALTLGAKDPSDLWRGPALLARHPVDSMKTLIEGLWTDPVQAISQRTNADMAKAKEQFKAGNYGQAVEHYLEGVLHGVEEAVPIAGPAGFASEQDWRAGRPAEAIMTPIVTAGGMLLPGGKKPVTALPHEAAFTDLGITPLTSEAKGSTLTGAMERQIAPLMGAREAVQPFIEHRKGEVAQAAANLGTSLAPQPVDIRQAAQRERENLAAAERGALGGTTHQEPTITAENAAYEAIRGNRDALRTVEGNAWNALERQATAVDARADVEGLKELSSRLLNLQDAARKVIVQSLPQDVLGLLARSAGNAEEQNASLVQISHQLGYSDVATMLQSNPQMAHTLRTGLERTLGPGQVDTVPFSVLKTARTGVGELLAKGRQHIISSGQGEAAVRYLTRAYAELSRSMQRSLEDHPDLSSRFEELSELTRGARHTYLRPKIVRTIVHSDPEELGKLYEQLMKPGVKRQDRVAITQALHPEQLGPGRPTADLDRFRDGLTNWILQDSATEKGVEGATLGPRINYDKALGMLDERTHPGIREMLGDNRYQTLKSELRQTKRLVSDPDYLHYVGFLKRIGGATDSSRVIDWIISKPDEAERAARLAGNNPGLDRSIAAGIFWRAVKKSERPGGNSMYIDSDRLEANLQQAQPAIAKFAGQQAAAKVQKFSDVLGRMNLSTGILDDRSKKGFLPFAQAYSAMRAVSDAIGGNVHGAIYNGAFVVGPEIFIRLRTAPGTIRFVKGVRQVKPYLGMFGKGLVKGAATTQPTFQVSTSQLPEAPTVTPQASAIPVGAKAYKVTRTSDGQMRELMLTPEEATSMQQEGYNVSSEVQ